MFRAIGFVIVLLTVSKVFSAAVQSFENALVATFEALETAAEVSRAELEARR